MQIVLTYEHDPTIKIIFKRSEEDTHKTDRISRIIIVALDHITYDYGCAGHSR